MTARIEGNVSTCLSRILGTGRVDTVSQGYARLGRGRRKTDVARWHASRVRRYALILLFRPLLLKVDGCERAVD